MKEDDKLPQCNEETENETKRWVDSLTGADLKTLPLGRFVAKVMMQLKGRGNPALVGEFIKQRFSKPT